ncbi:MFS transporter [Erwinia sp. OLTSP20]|uniref:MFS transporter n=1 Tax=unclassified Erwinia TaxID=2622719 RepID=UPI000C17C9CE|nr:MULTISPECIES: MFS transporter [unclassified Erwinia]PIJ49444.1 MFS transporter [Erwinia sp. OAMSP11]PIJ68975.1 MFS transporter [Erwinia sp. OLSSP12]PIJ80975.1 MFS transporter [Erwinia sp. OLMTSP26]PIJ83378.1 MFS transporter [Erwinia sp. OLMDSP33]PIJ84291.1 MFS transporter [Erwinia sp. OLCASP19]
MFSPEVLIRRLPSLQASAFLLVAFFSGIAGALQIPTLSLYLSQEIHSSPIMVGLFFTVNALVAIAISQFLAVYSDRRGERKTLILQCCLSGAAGALLFAWCHNYFVLIIAGTLLAGFGTTANPQMFALAREHADKNGHQAAMFSSVMRAQISLAWVIGPPLAFALAVGFGFNAMYTCAAIAFVVCALLVHFLLPAQQQSQPLSVNKLQAPRRNRRDTLLLFIACTLMWCANSCYLIAMPLYLVHQLQLSEKLAGEMIGVAAGLEIPVMLIAGFYAARLSKRRLLRISAVAALLFYSGLLFITSPLGLLLLQLFNALFIGLVAATGMLYFQDLMPGQAGAATTLFTNTSRVGWLFAGLTAGAAAQLWNYYSVFLLSMLMIIVTLGCLWSIRNP